MIRHTLLAAALCTALLACGGEPNNTPPDAGPLACGSNHPEVSTEQIFNEIFEPTCKTCHASGSSGTTFFADDAAMLQAAVGQDSAYPGTVKVIDPGHPENSTLFIKVSGGSPKHRAPDGTPVGGQMPQGGTLTEEQVQRFQDWICTGAD
jgi:cytochrome c5